GRGSLPGDSTGWGYGAGQRSSAPGHQEGGWSTTVEPASWL
ncbi:MAG: hypothetical protein AVDCRST_MAG76-1704, partial [uncultured Acidimicrobiales bacterium]